MTVTGLETKCARQLCDGVGYRVLYLVGDRVEADQGRFQTLLSYDQALGDYFAVGDVELESHLAQGGQSRLGLGRCPPELVGELFLFEQAADEFDRGDSGDRVSHGGEIQSCLAVRQEELNRAVAEVGISGVLSSDAIVFGFGGDGDGGIGHSAVVREHSVPDGFVETVVVTRAGVGTGQRGVVFNHKVVSVQHVEVEVQACEIVRV